MDDLFMLSEAQMGRIALYFPLSHGILRVDDRLIVSAITFMSAIAIAATVIFWL